MRPYVLSTLILLCGCGVEQTVPGTADDPAPPPTVPTFDLDVGTICPGEPVTLSVSGAPVGEEAIVLRARSHTASGPCRGPICVEIGPVVEEVSRVTAGTGGTGSTTVNVPAHIPPGTATWLQAVVPATGEVSDAVFVAAEDPAGPACTFTTFTCVVNPPAPGMSDALSVTVVPDDPIGQLPPITFQWQKFLFINFANIPGETGPALDSCLDRNNGSVYDCNPGDQLRVRCTPDPSSGLAAVFSDAVIVVP